MHAAREVQRVQGTDLLCILCRSGTFVGCLNRVRAFCSVIRGVQFSSGKAMVNLCPAA